MRGKNKEMRVKSKATNAGERGSLRREAILMASRATETMFSFCGT